MYQQTSHTQVLQSPEQCPALILNADYRPLSYLPLSLWSWQDAVKAIFRDTVSVLCEYDLVVRAPKFEMKLPSVLVLKDYIHLNRSPAFTRFNVFLRDRWQCQYCGGRFKTHELTFDHVVPRARGGGASWDNIVAACQPCNIKKGHKSCQDAGMFPIRKPRAPTLQELQAYGRHFPPHFLHESWRDYLYWDTELCDS